jgi:hypothetical protein
MVPGEAEIRQRVLEREKMRCKALLTDDVALAEAVLGDDLIFTNTQGRADDKKTYIANRRAAQVKFVTLEDSDLEVRIFSPEVALLRGIARSLTLVGGKERISNHGFVSIWVKRNGDWVLSSYDALPLPAGKS